MSLTLLLLLAGPGHAQESGQSPAPEPTEDVPRPPGAGTSPVARCADAAAGIEVEVCLQLAVDNPDQVDGIAAALRAHLGREGSSEQALLLVLLALVDDRTALDAARRIADLGDPRGLPALVACAEQRDPEVSAACIHAMAPFDAALSDLERWLTDDRFPLGLRIDAARTLGLVGSEPAADALIDVLRRPRLPSPLRRTILDTIDSAYPHRAKATEGQVASDGRLWLTLGGSYAMGYAMGAAGHYGQTNLAALGMLTGAVGGATGGWLYGRAWPMEAGQAAYITTNGILVSTGGMLVGEGLSEGDPDWIFAGGLLGLAVGSGAAIATRTQHPGLGIDSVEASFVGGLGALTLGAGVGFAQRATNSNPERTWVTTTTRRGAVNTRAPGARAPTLAAGLGLLGGTVLGNLTAHRVDLSRRDWGVISLSTSWGLGLASLLPVREPDERATLMALGIGAGGLVGYALSAPTDLAPDIQAASWAGGVYGGVFGAGVGLLIDPKSNAARYGAIGFGTAGLLGAGALAHLDPEPLDDRDIVLVGLTTGWAGWQAAGWSLWLSNNDPTNTGWFLVVPAAVSGGVAALTPVVDIPVPQSMAVTSLGLWGAYTGGVAAELSSNGDNALLWSLVGSNAGLAAGAVLMSPAVGTPPLVVAGADAGGVVGWSVSALGTALFTDQTRTILTTSLVGSSVGFATGAVIGASWKRGGTRDMARTPRMIPVRLLVRPDMGPDRMGMALEVREW